MYQGVQQHTKHTKIDGKTCQAASVSYIDPMVAMVRYSVLGFASFGMRYNLHSASECSSVLSSTRVCYSVRVCYSALEVIHLF